MSTTTPNAGTGPWTRDGRYYEYSKAVNPLGSGKIAKVPFADFPHTLHEEGESRVIPFDLSEALGVPYPASSPALLANFIRVRPGESVGTAPNATSELYHVIRGKGRSRLGGDGKELPWKKGDFFTLPAGTRAEHRADEDAAFYWVHDEPLCRYLGVRAGEPRFEPTLYLREQAEEELAEVAADPKARQRSRVSILLANARFEQTLTVTHTLWAMFGVLPKGTVQLPHRHESVALDFVIGCDEGCYTLIGKEVDEEGTIQNPTRADWKPGSAFVTPPGLWHSHHNESGGDAHVMPIQDAGLHNYLRTLDIRFVHPDHRSYISMKA